MPYPLDQLQRWLQAVITHPGGVTDGVASNAARQQIDVEPADVERVIAPSRALTSIERLEIYGNAYYARLLECLRETFPVLTHAVGREAFDQFALGYLQSFPPASYTLGVLGGRFAEYLEATRPDRAEADAGEINWPDLLIDLARFEWAIGEVFDGPGNERLPPFDPAELRAIDPQRWSEARLTLAPCVRLLALNFNVNDYFTSVRAEQEPDLPAPEPSWLVLTRINYVVRRIAISAQQYTLLKALAAGRTVGEAIEMLVAGEDQQHDGVMAAAALRLPKVARQIPCDLDTLVRDLPHWFEDWAEGRLFQAVELPR